MGRRAERREKESEQLSSSRVVFLRRRGVQGLRLDFRGDEYCKVSMYAGRNAGYGSCTVVIPKIKVVVAGYLEKTIPLKLV